MLASYAIGIVVIVLLMVAWVGVQGAWSRANAAVGATDPDALAGRMGCHGCSHHDDCSHKPAAQAVTAKEEMS